MNNNDEIIIQELTLELENTKKELEWYKAAHILIANSEAFIHANGDDVFWTDAEFKEGIPGLALNMNDVFFWGCADAEDFNYIDAPFLLEITKKYGTDGLIAWTKHQRLQQNDGKECWNKDHLEKYFPNVSEIEKKMKEDGIL